MRWGNEGNIRGEEPSLIVIYKGSTQRTSNSSHMTISNENKQMIKHNLYIPIAMSN